MIRLLVLLVLFASPAAASQDGWPALYDVENVASDDVLNIRRGPDAESPVIGSLAHDASDIEVIRDNDGRGTWGLVNFEEGTGWVSLAFMARHPGQLDGTMPQIRQCFGTEPFWSLAYDAPRVTLSLPEGAPREGLISGLFRSKTRRDRFVYAGSFFPADDGVLDVTLLLRREACGDGMSDRAFGITLDMFLSGSEAPEAHGLFSGCCSIAPPAR